MRNLITYFIKYPISGNVLMLVIFIFGWFGMQNLKSTFFPVSESKIINVVATYPGSSPEEIENRIIQTIENNLKGVSGIERVSSVSNENIGTITVEILKGYDIDLIVQDVKNAVDQINSFPPAMEPARVFKREVLNFAISFAISGNTTLKTLKEKAKIVEDDLRALPGISKVSVSGYPAEEIEVSFKEANLRAFDLSFQQAVNAIKSANIDLTGGIIKTNKEDLLIRARSKKYYANDLNTIVVKAFPDGRKVYLKDVAKVADKWTDNPNRTYLNGDPSVVFTIQTTINEDILGAAAIVRDYIDDFNGKNDLIAATIVRDSTVTLQQRIAMLTENGIVGFVLVLLFLSLFLNIRLSGWVAISIPISMLGMFILATFSGLTINVMSLFGMILVVGILVDDGIVIAESIYQKYEQGMPRIEAAIEGTMEVFPAVFSAIITTIIAFSTFYFLDGRLGDFAPDLAFVVMATLGFSLIEGAFILPAHVAHSKALQGKKKENWVEQKTNAVMRFLRDRLYAPVLTFSINNKLLSIAIPIALFMITIGGISGGIIRSTFFPSLEQDNISISLAMEAGTRDYITEDNLKIIEKAVWESNKVLMDMRGDDTTNVILKVERKIGPSAHEGSINVTLLDAETRNIPAYEVTSVVRDNTPQIIGTDKLLFGSGTPFGKPISVSLLGNNLEELNAASRELKEELAQLSAVKDITDNNQKGLKEVIITLKDKAELLGLNLQQVLAQVRQGFFGGEVQRLQRGQDEVKIWVRYAEEDRSSLERLNNMRIRIGNGKEYPLSEIANYEIKRGILGINHLDGKREIKVEAELSSPTISASDINTEIKNTIVADLLNKYPSVQASFEGQSKSAAKTQNSGAKVIPVILILMLTIVTLTFRSFYQAILIFLLIPFGLIGVGWGHWVHDVQISLLSGFGIIALIGIMVNDSLVFVSAFNGNMKAGLPFKEALTKAGLSRFRPIVLTSVTTISGLAPLILETSFQAQFLIPMAIATAYGLFIATYTTLIVLPVLLITLNTFRVYLNWLWYGKKPTSEEVEPAVKELEVENPKNVTA
ncbi:efflux RND transporter permease subunit [Flavobacteriales bacterium]|nr:efflux RND transporter permease subunit [Flavobacteriales bacterium]